MVDRAWTHFHLSFKPHLFLDLSTSSGRRLTTLYTLCAMSQPVYASQIGALPAHWLDTLKQAFTCLSSTGLAVRANNRALEANGFTLEMQ